MDNESIFDSMKIGMEYILVTVFLLATIKCLGVRNRYADQINKKYMVRVETQKKLEFSKYYTGTNQHDINECVSADVVMEAIRNYCDGSIQIYVDDIKNGTSLLLTETSAKSTPFYYTVQYLTQTMDFTYFYHPYLVYDNEDVEGPRYEQDGIEVTGIAFIRC